MSRFVSIKLSLIDVFFELVICSTPSRKHPTRFSDFLKGLPSMAGSTPGCYGSSASIQSMFLVVSTFSAEFFILTNLQGHATRCKDGIGLGF